MKKFLTLALLIVSAFTFSACQRKAPPETLVPAGQQIEFQIWTAQEKGFIEALLREFISEYKTTAIRPKVIEFADDAELQDFLVQKMAEGTGPDVVFTQGEWVAMNTKKLVPVTGDASFTPAAFTNTFVRAASETMVRDEQIYGIPMAVDSLAVFYNEEYLVDALEDRNTPADNWKEFKLDAEALSEQDNSFERFAVSGAALGRTDNVTYGFEILHNMLIQWGAEFFSPDGMRALFASSTGVSPYGGKINYGADALETFTSFADARFKNFAWSKFLSSPQDKDKDLTAFVAGKTAMVFGMSRDIERIEDMAARTGGSISAKNVRVAMFPQYKVPGKPTSKEIIGYPYGLVVPRTSENADTAWKFLKFAAKKENQISFWTETGMPTARLDLIAEQASHPELGVFARQAKFARAQVYPVNMADLERTFSELVEDINDGNMAPEKGLRNLERDWSGVADKYAKREKAIENQVKKASSQ